MLNNRIDSRAFKTEIYGAFAAVTKAIGSPRRLELLDLLAQGPRSVEALAKGTAQSVAGTSQHLQVLRRAGVVQTERHGTTIEYRLAPGVADVLVGVRRVAGSLSPAMVAIKERHFAALDAPEVISSVDLRARLADGTAVLLDVRPAEEFAHGHIAGATSIPIEDLGSRLEEVPSDRLVVATCRGPFCVFAADASQILRQSGREAVRFGLGVSDWVFDGGRLSDVS